MALKSKPKSKPKLKAKSLPPSKPGKKPASSAKASSKPKAKEPQRIPFTRFRYFNKSASDVTVRIRLRQGKVEVDKSLKNNQYIRPGEQTDDPIVDVLNIDTVIMETRVAGPGGLTAPTSVTLGPTVEFMSEACGKRSEDGTSQFCTPCPCT